MKTKKLFFHVFFLILTSIIFISFCSCVYNQTSDNNNKQNEIQKEKDDIFIPNFKYIYNLIEVKQTQEKNWLGIKGDITFYLLATITNTGNIDTFQINLTIYGERTGAIFIPPTIGSDSIKKIIPINQSVQIEFSINTGIKESKTYSITLYDYSERYKNETGEPIDIF